MEVTEDEAELCGSNDHIYWLGLPLPNRITLAIFMA